MGRSTVLNRTNMSTINTRWSYITRLSFGWRNCLFGNPISIVLLCSGSDLSSSRSPISMMSSRFLHLAHLVKLYYPKTVDRPILIKLSYRFNLIKNVFAKHHDSSNSPWCYFYVILSRLYCIRLWNLFLCFSLYSIFR